jgi:hypothetical protein
MVEHADFISSDQHDVGCLLDVVRGEVPEQDKPIVLPPCVAVVDVRARSSNSAKAGLRLTRAAASVMARDARAGPRSESPARQ